MRKILADLLLGMVLLALAINAGFVESYISFFDGMLTMLVVSIAIIRVITGDE